MKQKSFKFNEGQLAVIQTALEQCWHNGLFDGWLEGDFECVLGTVSGYKAEFKRGQN
jgi:hypothetical protein